MPRGGSQPGERRGGRKVGSLNKRTLENGAALSELAKAHCPKALEALVSVATKGRSEAARVSAAVAILDRGFGKPLQAHQLSGPDSGPIRIGPDLSKLSDQQLEQLKALLSGEEAAGGGPQK